MRFQYLPKAVVDIGCAVSVPAEGFSTCRRLWWLWGVRFQYLPKAVVAVGCEVSVPAEGCGGCGV